MDHFSKGWQQAQGWKPLTPKYKAWKAKRYPQRPMMRLTDRLRNATVNNAKVMWRGNQLVVVFTKLPGYTAPHRDGRLPKRDVFVIAPADVSRIAKAVRNYLRQRPSRTVRHRG